MNEMIVRAARKFCVPGMLFLVCLSQTSIAQESNTDIDVADSGDIAAAEPAASSTSEEIDEIVVLGAHSLTLLRQEIIVAEDEFFDLYNELNDDDRFDIICETRRPIGTRIRVRECKAKFVRDAEVDAMQDALMMNDSPANVTAQPIRASKKDYRILEEKLKTLAVENPELQEALMNYDNISKKYAQEREKKFE